MHNGKSYIGGIMYRLLLSLLLFITVLQPAFAWWNPDWTFRKAITIDTTAAGIPAGPALDEFSYLVKLHTGNFTYFFDLKEGGADLRFMAGDDQTPLKYYVEKLDPINEMALIWVKTALPATGSNNIYMYYGNAAAPAAADPAGTFDVNDVVALNFDTAGALQDKTAYANHPASFTGEINNASIIGAGARFQGSQSVTIANTPSLNLASDPGWTFSAWVKPTAQAPDVILFQAGDGATTYSLRVRGTALVAQLSSGGSVIETTQSELLQTDWSHVAMQILGDRMSIYLNGQEASFIQVPAAAIAASITVGDGTQAAQAPPAGELITTGPAPAALTGFIGEVDAVRISNVARTPAWFAAVIASQGKTSSLLAYGGDETAESEGEGAAGVGTFGIIIGSVFGNDEAIVEQLVIGLCGVMAIIAFLVMLFKAVFINASRKASKAFLSAYNELDVTDKNLDVLYGKGEAFDDSPLYRVYAQAVEELRHRISPAVGAEFAGLEDKAINAIRASLDARMVREGQRLNANMVLLTIAISGGPFIGLLGTVVGVMVTFAGIAAAGEVNINAIAPGMAAALLATVAGLGVAIPALFGYNYLGSRIKELEADMQVFADELLARIGEIYGA